MALTSSPREKERFSDVLILESVTSTVAVADLAGRPADVTTIDIDNQSNAAVYVKLYDATSALVSNVPVIIIMVINGTRRVLEIPTGVPFTKGVTMRCVKEEGTAGTTNPTAGNVGVSLVMR